MIYITIDIIDIIDTKTTPSYPLEEVVYKVSDFESVQDAITYVSKKLGGKLYFPPNQYVIKEELKIGEGVELLGAGQDQTTIVVNTPSGYLNKEGTSVLFSNLSVHGKVRNPLNSPISPEDFGAVGDGRLMIRRPFKMQWIAELEMSSS